MPTKLLKFIPALLFAATLAAEPIATTRTPATQSKNADHDDDGSVETSAATKSSPAEEKYWEAIRLSDSKDATQVSKARALLQAAADLEFPHAQTFLAECLMTGELGFPKDQRKAFNLYRLAAERGNAYAQVSLGQCYYFGNGVWKNREKAAEWLTAAVGEKADYSRPSPPESFLAAAKDDTHDNQVAGELERDPEGDCRAAAHYLLGLLAADAKKLDQAHKHFVAAATAGIDGRSGIYSAAVQAALNYAFGQGTSRDMTKANEMLATSRKLTVRAGMHRIHHYSTRKAVFDFDAALLEDKLESEGEKFQTETQYDIARTFTDKKSKDYNPAEAVKWFELAAENGSAWAMINLAHLYSGKELGQPDLAKAFAWFEKAGDGEHPKHYLATANLAICLQNGIGTTPDKARAAALFKKYSDDEFVCYLGTINQCPTKVLNWEERVKLIESWAKEKKDPHAQFMLGERYRDGWDCKVDLSAAIRWFKKSADANYGGAWYALASLHANFPSLFDETRYSATASVNECLRKGSEAGYPQAMADYACVLSDNLGKGQGDEVIEKLYLKCLELDPTNGQAHNNLAVLYENRVRRGSLASATKDKELMFSHYEAAVQFGFAMAARNLAKISEEGYLAPADSRKAYSYYEKAAELGMTTMHYEIAQMLEKGAGVPISYTEAAYHYRLAALEDHIPSLRRIIDLYLSGKTGEVDMERALFWLFKLARYDTDALTTAADVLLKKSEFSTALDLLRTLEREGSPSQVSFACERLGRCYERGQGVKANPSKAKKYFDRALAGGDPDAITWQGMQLMQQGKYLEAIDSFKRASNQSSAANFYLGQLYFFGTHVGKDQARGFQYMRRAAAANHPEALYFLAGTTFNNIPGAPSLEEALRLVTQAEAAGHEKAKDLRERLEKRRNKTNAPAGEEEAARARAS